MHEPGDVWATVNCDCGNQFDVSLVGHNPETMQITCPACGKVDSFTPEQAAAIIAEYEGAKARLNDEVRKTADRLKRAFK